MARCRLALLAAWSAVAVFAAAPTHFQVSGIYPHLATFNSQGECGTGALVPWADRLWVVSYSPHQPKGSDDKLYEITPDLRQIIRPESIGGTPANRFIHRESQQLFIGPYAIDAQRNVRVIPYTKMFGRPTGNARHLIDPAGKIYYASMEEGFYEVDVHTLAVTELFRDEQLKEPFRRADLPGYHGKGLYSGQGVLVYANNGEHGKDALSKPDIPSGALAEWDGRSDSWTVVRRNQFCEVTGPGDLYGNRNPATDPIWTIGWDHRSLILMVREPGNVGGVPSPRDPNARINPRGEGTPPTLADRGNWHAYRLPKASHAYDGAHGWNTEWPRIRDIGENDLLMTMHGAFWRFPRDFAPGKSSGLAPRSNYLKVVADFTRWGDRLVLGCDDTAMSEFLNKRRAKGKLAAPGQSQSNLWFIEPAQLDQFGPAIGRGAVWLEEPVRHDVPSEPYLFSGFEQRMLHLAHEGGAPATFTLEVDREGDGRWTKLRDVVVPGGGYAWTVLAAQEKGAWIRLRCSRDCSRASAVFAYRNRDRRTERADARFDGISGGGATAATAGLLHARGKGRKTLGFAATSGEFYEMGDDLKLRRSEEAGAAEWMQQNVAIPADAVTSDAASILYTDEAGRRYRLPRAAGSVGGGRALREVCTERDLLNCGGTFFELPAENAGGIPKVRPIATHGRRVHDYASWRGMLVMSGVDSNAAAGNAHVVRSEDGRAAVWLGVVDDLWAFGKPRGEGGPWKDTAVRRGVASDPYLMTGYDRKSLRLSHGAATTVRIQLEVDIAGTGHWLPYATFEVRPGKTVEHAFPAEYQAYWLRVSADADTTATAWLVYD